MLGIVSISENSNSQPANCKWESGYIQPITGSLKGPFLVYSLMAAGSDSSEAAAHVFVVTSFNAGFYIQGFNGPFFVPDGGTLTTGKDARAGFLYSGCRM